MSLDAVNEQVWGLGALPAGWHLHYLPVTGSTNEDAKLAALRGCPDRTVILAEEQRAGRGRLGRHWLAPPRTSLLFSIVLHRLLSPVRLTALCSVSVAQAIQETTGLAPRVKWPNDVMVRDRKVCGILTEVLGTRTQTAHGEPVEPWVLRQAQDERVPHITIVGIGLNVNLDPPSAGLPRTATSLSNEVGRPISRRDVLHAVLDRIGAYLALDDATLGSTIFERWESLLWRRQQEVQIDSEGPVVRGVVEGLSSSGALRVRRTDGTLLEIAVGELAAPDNSS